MQKIEQIVKFAQKIDDLYSEWWGKGLHDSPVNDDNSLLLKDKKYRTGSFSTDKQVLPDSYIKWLKNPSWFYKALEFTGAVPKLNDVANIASDPYASGAIHDFLSGAPSLPANWSELSKTMEEKKPSFGVPDHFWTPFTNAVQYAAHPLLTGKEKYVRGSDNSRVEEMIARRLAKAMRNNMGR